MTYIDAGVANTVGAASGLLDWNSGTDMPPTTGDLAADGLWRFRADQGYDALTNSPNGGIWEASGSNATIEDAVELKTTITGLANGLYNIYVFFDSSTGGDWPIRAGLTSNPGANQIFAQGGTPGAMPGYNVADPVFGLTFTGSTPASQAENVLYAPLGEVNITDGSFSVFVDDLPATSSGGRTWYEGVGYELATSGPPIITSVMSGPASSASTWSNNQPPSFTNDYHVQSGHTVTVASPFDGHELRINSGGVVDLSASAVHVPLIIVESGANLTETVSGEFALGDISQATLGVLQLNQDIAFDIDAGTDFFLDMNVLGQGNIDFNSGAGSTLWLSDTDGHIGTIRFNGTGDQVNITEQNQGVGTLEMNSTGDNILFYNPLQQADDGTVVFNQPGTIVHAASTTTATRRLHGPNILVANAPITIDITTGYPTTESPTEERRLLITGALQGDADVTVNGTPTDLSNGGAVSLNEFEIGGTGEPTGNVVTDPYSGTIIANDFVNLEIRHNLPNAGFEINNHARLEMGHQAIPNAKTITFGEVTVNDGGIMDVGFEQSLGTATDGYTSGHHAYHLILSDDGGRSGGLTLADGSTVRLQVNGTAADQFDHITADGDIALNGTLNILVNPPGTAGGAGSAANPQYTPAIDDIFDIISITSATVVGDYDGNGTVGPEDYSAWKGAFGTNNAAADGNENGVVDAADYVLWRDNVGQMGGTGGAVTGTFDNVVISDPLGTFSGFNFQVLYSAHKVQLKVIAAGAGALAAVPEPSTFVLVGLLLPLLSSRRRSRS